MCARHVAWSGLWRLKQADLTPCRWAKLDLNLAEFEGVLHPIFEEDELTLILTGCLFSPPPLLLITIRPRCLCLHVRGERLGMQQGQALVAWPERCILEI